MFWASSWMDELLSLDVSRRHPHRKPEPSLREQQLYPESLRSSFSLCCHFTMEANIWCISKAEPGHPSAFGWTLFLFKWWHIQQYHCLHCTVWARGLHCVVTVIIQCTHFTACQPVLPSLCLNFNLGSSSSLGKLLHLHAVFVFPLLLAWLRILHWITIYFLKKIDLSGLCLLLL